MDTNERESIGRDNGMKQGWEISTVAKLIKYGKAEVKTGPFGTQLRASDYVAEGTPVINVRNIGFGNIREGKLEYIGKKTVKRLNSHLLYSGDIVFGRKGAVERHVLVGEDQNEWFQGSDCLRLRITSKKLSSRFLSYCFLTEFHKKWMMNQCSHGATMASLNQDIIKRIPLKIPPLPVQERIAGVLSAYDELIENNRRRIQLLEEMAQTIYREWFVHFRFPGHEKTKLIDSKLGPIPQGWEVKTLGDIAESMRRNIQKGKLDTPRPYVGLEHIPRRSLALNDWEVVTELGSSKLEFKKDEILFGKIRPYFHKVSVAPFNGLCSSDVIVIRARRSELYALVTMCVSSDDFVAHATATSNGSKMPRANWRVLEDYPITIPAGQVADKFSTLVTDIFAQQQSLIFKIQNLRTTRDLLLPKLISGEIEV